MIGPGSHARANGPARPRKTTAPPCQHQVHDDPDMPVRGTVLPAHCDTHHTSSLLVGVAESRQDPTTELALSPEPT